MPRTILRIELAHGAPRAEARPWSAAEPAVQRVGSWGGAALAVALAYEARHEREAPFVVSVGEGVRRGLPTAARACVASRSPLSGGYADGHVGGALGRALAGHADALALRGRADPGRAVLVLRADGSARLEPAPVPATARVRERLAALRAAHARAALLTCGPAGEAGIPFASVANEADPPSFTGRGGLGAALGRLGLVALVVEPRAGAEVAPSAPPGLSRALAGSPRLRARGEGGTLEQAAAFAARGDDLAPGLAPELARPVDERKGCAGCPTPCGWVFERAGSGAVSGAGAVSGQGARFGALAAVGPALGLAGVDAPLELLALCDELGLDAKETGAALALLCDAAETGRWDGRSARGDAAALAGWIESIPARSAAGALLAGGAAALARRFGLPAAIARGQAARAQRDLAGLLGQCVSTRGADPMRTFAFLAADVPDRARLERLLAPWPVCAGTEDPNRPEGKGRLVAWHEAFLAAVDASGFCAFSAAALLADGLVDLDQLCRWIAPEALCADLGGDGRALIAAGASVALVQRALAREWGGRADDDRPDFARERLAHPGMLAEYAALRGLASDGGPTRAAWSRLGTRAVLDLAVLDDAAPARTAVADGTARRVGRIGLSAAGPLGAALGAPRALERELPAPLLEVLEGLAREIPVARPWLLAEGRAVPACWRGGVRLEPDELVRDGDELDLVVALSGG